MTYAGTGTERASPPSAEDVADVLPLLPLQKALLLLRESTNEDPGLLQVRCTLDGELDPDVLHAAWETVVTWHSALRMSIWSPEAGDPAAIVWKAVTTPWDYRGPVDEDALDSFLAEDRERGIDVAGIPPWRITVSRIAEHRYELTWTCHHVIFDGWSSAIVLDDVLSVYQLLARGKTPPSAPVDRLRAFHAARKHAGAASEGWWRQYLARLEGDKPLPLGDGPQQRSTRTISIPASVVVSLKQAASEWGATDNAIIQAALGIALSSLHDSDDVVFGTTISGRNLDIEGMDRIVGYLANAVPIRVTVNRDEKASDLATRLRTKQFEMQPYEHASLAEIHDWSGLPGFKPMFETFLVVENFPLRESTDSDDVTMTSFRSDLTTAYPVTVAVTFDGDWHLRAESMADRVNQTWVESLMRRMASVIAELAGRPLSTVGHLMDQLDRVREPGLTAAARGDDGKGEYDLPVTLMEHRIARVWEQVLGLPNIGIYQDYFDLGGTSVLALRLFDAIETETGVRLPLKTILAHPTIRGLAAAASGGTPDSEWRSLVPMKEWGSGDPLFCVHSGGGNALTYRDLARALASDRPVYGLTAVGLDGEVEPLDSTPEMARLYIEEIKLVQPKGPYVLIGHCFGGSVCLEMAHQLEQNGDEVRLVVGIDASLPLPEPSSTWRKVWGLFRARGVRGLAKAAKRRFHRKSDSVPEVLWDGSTAEHSFRDQMRHRVLRANQHAFMTFHPSPVESAKLLITSAERNVPEGIYWTYDWDAVGAGTEVLTIEASHGGILRSPWVERVAQIIDERT